MKRNKTFKRFLAFVLCAAMMIAYMPSSVYSATDESAGSQEVALGSGEVTPDGETGEANTPAGPVEEVKGEEISDAVDTVSKTEDNKVEEEASTEKDANGPVPEPITLIAKKSVSAKAAKADSTPEFNVQGSKKASPTTLGKDRKTTVTLEMPSGEYQNEVDIVFAMDSSSSAQNSVVFTESVNALFDSIREENENLKLKVGVIRFRGRAHDAVEYTSDKKYSGLTEYNDDTKGYIEEALNMTETQVKAAFGNGSNTHAGIDIADEWLAADTEVDNSNKYLILLTDGKTYIWNNDDNEPTTIYSQWYRSNSYPMQNKGIPQLNQSVGYNKYAYSVDVLDPSGNSNVFVFKDTTDPQKAYADLYNSTSEELVGVSEWDQPCLYADDKNKVPSGTVVKHSVTNGAELFGTNSATYGSRGEYKYYFEYTPDEQWKDLKYLEGNPFVVIENSDGSYTFDTTKINPNYYQYHVDCLQKGMYKAGHLWSDVNKKYNCAVITYEGGSNDTALSIIRPSFLAWMKENSKYGASITDSDKVKELFKDIDNSIRYMVGSGVVTDKIADEFTLVKPSGGASPFKMTHDGQTLSSSSAGDNKWNFGTATDGVYPYIVEYDESNKTITWTINVPIENLKKITLSYDLVLGDEYPSGTYDTNESAVLVFTSSDGKYKDQEYNFEKPKVTYKEDVDYTLTINYVYAGGGTAATSYKATLKAGASYGPINSPAITGYKPDRASVSGVMPEGNVTINVVYSAIPDDDPDDSEGAKTGDESDMMELLGLFGLSAAGLYLLARRRREQE